MAKRRKKTDFSEHRARDRELRDYLEREWAKLRERRAAEARRQAS